MQPGLPAEDPVITLSNYHIITLVFLCYLEHSRQVKAEPDLAFPEIVCSTGDEGFFVHSYTVAKM